MPSMNCIPFQESLGKFSRSRNRCVATAGHANAEAQRNEIALIPQLRVTASLRENIQS
jgi:hypothetical protein